jgi:hypothetical protein
VNISGANNVDLLNTGNIRADSASVYRMGAGNNDGVVMFYDGSDWYLGLGGSFT